MSEVTLSQLYADTTRSLSALLPDRDTVQKVASFAKKMSPFFLSYQPNLRSVSVGIMASNIVTDFLLNIRNEPAKTALFCAANAVNIVDLSFNMPISKEFRVAADSLVLLNSAVQSAALIGRFSLLTTLGIAGLIITGDRGVSLVTGAYRFEGLDPQQQMHALVHRSLIYLGKESACHAVVLNGPSIPVPNPFIEQVYKYCNTQVYDTISSPSEFCRALESKHRFNLVVLNAHGNNTSMQFSNDYLFKGNDEEVKCLENALDSQASLFLLGCNTATSVGGKKSLTRIVAEKLPGIEVTGIAANYIPSLTTTYFYEGHFLHDSHDYLSINGWVNPISTAVTLTRIERSETTGNTPPEEAEEKLFP